MESENLCKPDPSYIRDIRTPRHKFLSARYKQSFAYKTMKIRLPQILQNIMEDITKNSDNITAEFGEVIRKDIRIMVDKILQLKYELENDYVMETFVGIEGDKRLWNGFLSDLDNDSNTFLKACWLYAECYIYRRLYYFFENHMVLKAYDYFSQNKQNAFITSVEAMLEIFQGLESMKTNLSVDNLKILLKLNLWGNRCDLSISSGKEVKLNGNPFELVKSLDKGVIIDESSQVIESLKSADRRNAIVIEFICDNAGYELFTDFILADYLIESKLADKVRFNLKAIPWFISDATVNDFRWSLQFMKDHATPVLRDYGKKWQKFIGENKFEVANINYFWTSPYEYYRMSEIDPDLYKRLSVSHLVIFKGDLNYRKLISDFSWDFTESFETCLRGFRPTNICSLRTVKADLICGLLEGQSDILEKESKDWMITGEYGTIQFANKCKYLNDTKLGVTYDNKKDTKLKVQSFAYFVLRYRLPHNLSEIIFNLSENLDILVSQYGEVRKGIFDRIQESRVDFTKVIYRIGQLKYRLEHDGPFHQFSGAEPDKDLWNYFLLNLEEGQNTFFSTCFLYAECYVFRRLICYLENTQTLKTFDYYVMKKHKSLIAFLSTIEIILFGIRTVQISDDVLRFLLRLNLWGNQCDISADTEKYNVKRKGPFEHLRAYEKNIIIDSTTSVINSFKSADHSKPVQVDFICDNAGYELVVDFILGHYLLESKLADKVRFHMKAVPWFVTDATITDFHWTLQQLKKRAGRCTQEYAKIWLQNLNEGKFEVAEADYFWTSPYEFYKMRDVRPDLYKQLTQAHMVIIKGDCNYRKLIGDFRWDASEPFITCIRGFQPANICSLRIVKTEIICGMSPGKNEDLAKKNKDWMLSGEYGTIQFIEKNYCGCPNTIPNSMEHSIVN